MIARELTEFFAGFAPDGAPVVLGADDPMFLSNVNACYRRDVLGADPLRRRRATPRTRRSRRAMRAHGWRRAYHPAPAVLHAHDYSPVGFMRRYFDEYRGLRETSGHVERIGVRSTRARRARLVAGRPALDARAGLAAAPAAPRRPAARRCTTRARKLVVGARLAARTGCRTPLQRAISLEGAAPRRAGPARRRRAPARAAGAGRRLRGGPRGRARRRRRRCWTRARAWPTRERLHIAVVIPPFRRGSGGHSTIYNLLSRLEERGHTVSTWLYDPTGRHRDEWPAVVRGEPARVLPPDRRARSTRASTHWYGADVVLATGWDTVYPVLRLPNVPRPRLPRAGPRARVLRHLGRVGVRRAHLRPRACTASPPARGCATSCATATARRHVASSSASTTTSTTRAPVERRARHGDLLRARRRRRGAPCRSACWRCEELHRRRPDTALRAVRRRARAVDDAVPVRAPRRRDAGRARVGLLRGDGRALAVADELLADPAGDARLRAAVRRAGRAQHRGRVRRRRADRARARPTRSRSPTRSSGCSTTAGCGSAARARASSSRAEHAGSARPTRSRPACATRCARGRSAPADAATPPIARGRRRPGWEESARAVPIERAATREATDRLLRAPLARGRRDGRAGAWTAASDRLLGHVGDGRAPDARR